MQRRLIVLGLAGAALPAHAAKATAAKATATVVIDNFTFTPAMLQVSVGTTVTFVNHDDLPHSIVSAQSPPSFKSKALDTDDSFTHIFDSAGNYSYFCGLHPHMKGMVMVA